MQKNVAEHPRAGKGGKLGEEGVFGEQLVHKQIVTLELSRQLGAERISNSGEEELKTCGTDVGEKETRGGEERSDRTDGKEVES